MMSIPDLVFMTITERLEKIRELLPDDEISITIPIRVLSEWLNEPSSAAVYTDLTVEEVAEKLNRSPGTIRNWCLNGVIPTAYKLNGREWRIPTAALDRLRDVDRAEKRVARARPAVDFSSWKKCVS